MGGTKVVEESITNVKLDSVTTADKKFSTVVDALIEKELSTLLKKIDTAELSDTLKGDGPLTVFAPDNDAFDQLTNDESDDQMKPENKEALKALLQRHVVSQTVMEEDLENEKTFKNLAKEDITVTNKNGKVTIKVDGAEAEVKDFDLTATNGVVHIINKVLKKKEQYTVTSTMTFNDNLDNFNGNEDKFIAAFKKAFKAALPSLPSGFIINDGEIGLELKDGKGITVTLTKELSDAEVKTVKSNFKKEQFKSNFNEEIGSLGVTLDSVSIPIVEVKLPTILDKMEELGLTTLVKAVKKAELVEDFKNNKTITVFAPNEEAFKELSAVKLETLFDPNKKEILKAVIQRHVVPGKKLMAENLQEGESYETAGKQKAEIKVKRDGQNVTITFANVNADVTKPDKTAGNGVVHIIDKVLIKE